MKEKRPLIIIGGATGVGKTALSVSLAGEIGGEVISADSVQVYKGFDIGSAKIRQNEMQGIPHHLLDILRPEEEFNIYLFQSLTKDAMERIYAGGHIPVITGGTGFYIQSIIYDVDFEEESPDKTYRLELEALAKSKGNEFLHEMLSKVDPKAAAEIHPNNSKRVIRALEFFHETGRPISEHNEEQHLKESPYNFAYFVLNRSRSVIYDRINARVEEMISNGLEAEVRHLLASGVSPLSQPMKSLGYKEMNEYIAGKCTFDEAVYNIKMNTRHFAKRQNTWFKRENDAIWINYEDYRDDCEMLEKMKAILKEKKIV